MSSSSSSTSRSPNGLLRRSQITTPLSRRIRSCVAWSALGSIVFNWSGPVWHTSIRPGKPDEWHETTWRSTCRNVVAYGALRRAKSTNRLQRGTFQDYSTASTLWYLHQYLIQTYNSFFLKVWFFFWQLREPTPSVTIFSRLCKVVCVCTWGEVDNY